MRNNTVYIRQYIVNYRDEDTFKRLKSFGSVTYSSKVLNVLFIDTHKGIDTLKNIEGVTFAKQTMNRLYSNKRR